MELTQKDTSTAGPLGDSDGSQSSSGQSRRCMVVGMGASAGGLDAFQKFFAKMPADSGLAFVLVQHLSPTHETLIPELLAQKTPMPVQQVRDETAVEPNHVYVIPPNASLVLEDGVLRVATPGEPPGPRTTIDAFFRSLAEDQGENAVCILLSGTGSDGTLGLKAIKEHGGMAMAQNAESAAYDSMPRSAIATGLVDYVLPVEQMPTRLIEYCHHLPAGQPRDQIREQARGQLGAICAILRRKTGHEFRQYKQGTLIRRIQRRVQVLQLDSMAEYVERLRDTPKEVDQLFKDLLIGVTQFFRDPEAFEALSAAVLPKLFANKGAGDTVRVWVAGCGSGEEAYSIAILLREHMSQMDAAVDVQVFATDIDEAALEFARHARYPENVTAQVSPQRLERFFVREGSVYVLAKEVRDLCIFSNHDVIQHPPFSRLDLISCRNLLIYLEADLQKKLMPLFHYALSGSGYLFLGPSESVASHTDLFRTVDRKHRIYQCRTAVARPTLSFPLLGPAQYREARPDRRPQAPADREHTLQHTVERLLLQNYAPACVVLNERGELVYSSGRTGKYLELPPGGVNLNVLDMARKGLRLPLRTALHKASQTGQPVSRKNVAVEGDHGVQCIDLLVQPFGEVSGDEKLFVAFFQELAAEKRKPKRADDERAAAEEPLVQQLESELKTTRGDLQATIEELETANEELKSSNEELLSMNEELQSSNEEMETSKEELQSVNEELRTVNGELGKKMDALDRANSDLHNLFNSTRIATIFLDQDLRIKKFTPAIGELFRLMDSDVGRPVTDFAQRFDYPGLVADIHEVLRSLATKETQVRLVNDQAWYIARILPYRTIENVIDGVVISFVDISDLKRAELERGRLAAIVDSSEDAIIGATLDGTITSWNAAAERMYGYTAAEILGQNMSLLATPEQHDAVPLLLERIHRGEYVRNYESLLVRKDGTRIDVAITVSPIKDGGGNITGASTIAHDISERKRAEEQLAGQAKELARSNAELEQFASVIAHDLRSPLTSISASVQFLAEDWAGKVGPEAQESVAAIRENADRMGDLIKGLLAYALVGSELKTADCDCESLLKHVLQALKATVTATGAQVTHGALPKLRADKSLLAQLFQNLIENAIKYRGEEPPRIHVSAEEIDGAWAFSVRDNGIGVAPKHADKIFQIFRRGHSNPGKYPGLGVGLATCKKIVEQHGGRIWVESQPGQGASFRFTLPR